MIGDNPYRVAELLGLALPSSAWRQAGAGGMEAAVSAGFPKAALYSLAKLLESDPVRVNELAHSVVPKIHLVSPHDSDAAAE